MKRRYVIVRAVAGLPVWRVIQNRKADIARFAAVGSKPLTCARAMSICYQLNYGANALKGGA